MKLWYYVMNADYTCIFYEIPVDSVEQGVRMSNAISDTLVKKMEEGVIIDFQIEVRY